MRHMALMDGIVCCAITFHFAWRNAWFFSIVNFILGNICMPPTFGSGWDVFKFTPHVSFMGRPYGHIGLTSDNLGS